MSNKSDIGSKEQNILPLEEEVLRVFGQQVPSTQISALDSSSGFSAYGEFTPISVRSYTMIKSTDARLERD